MIHLTQYCKHQPRALTPRITLQLGALEMANFFHAQIIVGVSCVGWPSKLRRLPRSFKFSNAFPTRQLRSRRLLLASRNFMAPNNAAKATAAVPSRSVRQRANFNCHGHGHKRMRMRIVVMRVMLTILVIAMMVMMVMMVFCHGVLSLFAPHWQLSSNIRQWQ